MSITDRPPQRRDGDPVTKLPPHIRARLNDAADAQVADAVAQIDKELKPAMAGTGSLIIVLLLATFTAAAPAAGLPWWVGTLAAGWLVAGLMVRNLRRRTKAVTKAMVDARAKSVADALRQIQEREQQP